MTEKERLGRERLREAFRKINADYLEKYPASCEEIIYSPEYVKNMARISGAVTQNVRRKRNISKRYIAAIVAAILIFSCAATAYAFKAPIAKLVSELNDTFSHMFFKDNDISRSPSSIESVRLPNYLPQGYSMESQNATDLRASVVYTNGEKRILFGQYVASYDVTLDKENSFYREFIAEEMKIACAEKYGEKTFVWSDGEYIYDMVVSSQISDEECIKIIVSVGE